MNDVGFQPGPVTRPVGLETEFGVLRPGDAYANPVVLSSRVVEAYCAGAGVPTVRWDYEGEDPLVDLRGGRLRRSAAHPSQLTDDPTRPAPSGDAPSADAGKTADPPPAPWGSRARPSAAEAALPRATTAVLVNGARFYVDHAHPEYSSPEVLTPRDALIWDRAGEVVARRAMTALDDEGDRDGTPAEIVLYKNNVDGKGAAYGSHENYLVRRDVPFEELAAVLTPFLVTRPVLVGAGRVGIGQRSERPGFQISQRADYVESEIGLQTTFNRPIINTRDEALADSGAYRRMHVIVGDTNVAEPTTALKVGMTELLIHAIEDGLQIEDLALADPMRAIREVNSDLSGSAPLELANGRTTSAVALQREIHERVLARIPVAELDPMRAYVVDLWGRGIDAIASGDWSNIDTELDIAIKHKLLTSYCARSGASLTDPRVARLELSYSDITADGLWERMERAGLMRRLTTVEGVHRAQTIAPATTRAHLRGRIIAAAEDARADLSVDWVHVRLDESSTIPLSLQDPLATTDPRVDALIAQIDSQSPTIPA